MEEEQRSEDRVEKRFFGKSRWGTPITVEPALFIVVCTGAIADGVITNLLSERVCVLLLHYPIVNCTNVESQPSLEKMIQPYTSRLLLGKVLVETLLPVLTALFIGPWSDSNGRKLFITLPVVGYSIAYMLWGVLTILDVNPYLFLLAPLPIALSSGLAALCISCACYITDVSTSSERPYRLGLMEASINLGMLVGFFISPYLFKLGGQYGFITVFFTNSALNFLMSLYIIFVPKESIKKKKEEKRSILNVNHIKDMYKVISARRKFHGRGVILLLTFVYAIRTLIIEGESGVRYLTVRREFSWELHQFTTYVVINMIFVFAGSWSGIWFLSSFLKLAEMPVALGTLAMMVVSSVGMTLSRSSLMFYVTTNLSLLRSVSGPLITAHIVSIVTKDDTGKVITFENAVGAVTPQIAALLYNGIYSLIEYASPMDIYLVSAVLWIVCILFLIIVLLLERKKPD